MGKPIKCHLWCYSVTGMLYDRGVFPSKKATLEEAKSDFWHGYIIKELKGNDTSRV